MNISPLSPNFYNARKRSLISIFMIALPSFICYAKNSTLVPTKYAHSLDVGTDTKKFLEKTMKAASVGIPLTTTSVAFGLAGAPRYREDDAAIGCIVVSLTLAGCAYYLISHIFKEENSSATTKNPSTEAQEPMSLAKAVGCVSKLVWKPDVTKETKKSLTESGPNNAQQTTTCS